MTSQTQKSESEGSVSPETERIEANNIGDSDKTLNQSVNDYINQLAAANEELRKEIAVREQTESMLRESEELHRITLIYISDAVFITDGEGKFTFVCPNVAEIFGYNFEEVWAMNYIAGLIGADFPFPKTMAELEVIRNVEHTILDKGGKEHVLLINMKRVDIKGGTLLYSMRDITERKKLKTENKQLTEKFYMLKPLINENIEFSLNMQNNLWPIKGDASQIEQVIMNLVLNAADAMPEGGRLTIQTLNIHAGAASGAEASEASQPWVLVEVNDTGQGMDEETRQRIFEPFFTTKPTGTGLGLATVHGIVTQSGGKIEVASKMGVGTTVTVFLPPAETSV